MTQAKTVRQDLGQVGAARSGRPVQTHEGDGAASPVPGGPAAAAGGGGGEISRLRQPLLRWWLLLLVADGPSYGYELAGALNAAGFGQVRSPYVYQTLRSPEESGFLVSQWQVSHTPGPPRRVYELTGAGRSALDDCAANVAVLAAQLHRYQRRYRHLCDHARGDGVVDGRSPPARAV